MMTLEEFQNNIPPRPCLLRENLGIIYPGDTAIFKRHGPLAGVLAPVLKWDEARSIPPYEWDGWGWHMAKFTRWDPYVNDWRIIEATWPRVREAHIRAMYPGDSIRVYRWLDTPPSPEAVEKAVAERLLAKYDVVIYPLTVGAELSLLLLHWQWPRLWDGSYSCWELSQELDVVWGKAWPDTFGHHQRYPRLTGFLRAKPQFIGEFVL